MCRCGGASEHDHLNASTVTVSKSLHSHIVMDYSSVLNAKNPSIFHASVLREKFLDPLNNEDLRSECDDQLLITIMFAGTVKVKGIEVLGSKANPQKSPTKMKVFVNAANVDFTNVDTIPVAQEFDLYSDAAETDSPLRYSTRAAKFFNVNKITLLFERPVDGGKFIEINYLGFEGEFSQTRVGAVKAEYEIKPMLTDHKSIETVNSTIN